MDNGDCMNVEREAFYKAKKGSKLHLNYLIETNYLIVYKYIYRLTFNKELSEDIAQETCIRFIINLKNFEYEAKVSTLMITIGNNLLKDYYKKINRKNLKIIKNKEWGICLFNAQRNYWIN